MDLRNKFWLFTLLASIGILAVVGFILVLFWRQLSPAEQDQLIKIFLDHLGLIFLVLMLMAGGAVMTLDAIFNSYVIPVNKLAEELTLITTANPSHRIHPHGVKPFPQLCQTVNEMADRLQELDQDIKGRIQEAREELEREKRILEAIIAELTEGIVACNLEGEILLYNRRAKFMLYQKSVYGQYHIYGGELIGLGRSIFTIIDRDLISHALEDLSRRLARGETELVYNLVSTVKGIQLLRIQIVPILDHSREITGFIAVLRDITQRVEKDKSRGSLLQSLTEKTRNSVAGIRAASESLLHYPEMDPEQRQTFLKIIHDESMALTTHLDEAAGSQHFSVRWPLEKMRVSDLFSMLGRKLEERSDLRVHIEPVDDHLWVRVGSYSIVQSLLFVINQMKLEMGIREFRCRADLVSHFVSIDLVWQGPSIQLERLRQWQHQPLVIEDDRIPLTLREIAKRHEGEMWSQRSKDPNTSYFRLLLPAAEAEPEEKEEEIPAAAFAAGSRPEFYDFDLFDRPARKSEMDDQLLSQLIYTVFDTETTGLNPRGGDEIISFGAVRILNGRMLQNEIFDQLVDPQRSLPHESVKVHGIRPEMLEGQPTIEKVMPLFYQFAENTVLVAHNAAFDMLLLELKEKETGVKFINPVLDTLLLSAVIHPSQEDHNLERVAERMGVKIRQRHTALGDAFITAEIFLKMIPLLNKKGIHTLSEAYKAARKTYYARLKY